MTLRDYYFGRRITMRSPLRPDEIQQSIRDSTNVPFWWKPFHVGPVGGVRWGRLKLRFASSPLEHNAKPVLEQLIDFLDRVAQAKPSRE